jgi:hypothetical protein
MHTCIVGNELKETAVAVSKGLDAQAHEDYHEYKHPGNNRDDMYWLYAETEVKPNKTVLPPTPRPMDSMTINPRTSPSSQSLT